MTLPAAVHLVLWSLLQPPAQDRALQLCSIAKTALLGALRCKG